MPLKQVSLKPCSLVFAGAGDSLNPRNPAHHRSKVPAITKVRPVRRDPPAQVAGPAQVQSTADGVPEPVDAGRGRKAARGYPRRTSSARPLLRILPVLAGRLALARSGHRHVPVHDRDDVRCAEPNRVRVLVGIGFL